MIITINENIRIWKEFNPIGLSLDDNLHNSSDLKRNVARLGFNKERIAIKDHWFDVLTTSELIRKRNKNDGYYRVVYFNINMKKGLYYICKANRQINLDLKTDNTRREVILYCGKSYNYYAKSDTFINKQNKKTKASK